jgi:hypothetical protein
LRLRLFPLSLTGGAYVWFATMSPNFIRTWSQLEQVFYRFFRKHNEKDCDISVVCNTMDYNINAHNLALCSSNNYSQISKNSASMLVNEKIGNANSTNPASYFQPSYTAQLATRVEVASTFSAPHVNANMHDLAPYVSNSSSQINENSACI